MPYLRNRFRAFVLFIAATVAYGIILFFTVEYLSDRRHSEEARQTEHVNSLSIAISNDIELQISEALRPIEALGCLITETGGNRFAFEAVAQKLLSGASSVAALQLAPEGVVQYIYPLQGNEAALGHQLLKDPYRRQEVLEAISMKKAILAGPVNMLQGGTGIFVRVPVFIDDNGENKLWGLAIALLRWDTIVATINAQLNEKDSYRLIRKLQSDKDYVLIGGQAATGESISCSTRIDIPGGAWIITAYTEDTSLKHFALSLTFAFVFLTALLICVYVLLHKYHVALMQKNNAVSQSDRLKKKITVQQAHHLIANKRIVELSTIMDNITLLVFYTDINDIVLNANQSALMELSRDISDVVGHNIKEFLPGAYAAFRMHTREIVATGQPQLKVINFMQTPAGGRWFCSDRIPIVQDGVVIGIMNTAIDVTELKSTEEALRQLTRRYTELTRQVPVGIYTLHSWPDGSARMEYINEKACAILGLSASEVLADFNCIFDSAHPDDRASLQALNDKSLAEQCPFQWEGRLVRHGCPVWIRVESAPVAATDGGYMWDGVIIDMTSQKNLENQLKVFATFDGLTNMYNRRCFLELGGELLADSDLANKPLSVGIVDIDHFKRVNDIYGHSCGDAVLAEMGKVFAEFFEGKGLVGRLGGEEFGVFLLGYSQSEAAAVFEEFRSNVSGHVIRYMQSELRVTVSCGVYAGFFKKQKMLKDILKKADAALYKAKSSGRNCVVVQD